MFGKKSITTALFALLLVVAILLAGCANQPAAQTGGEPVKIGAIFDLTGATADVGTPYSEGVKGFVEWKNANGGINGRSIELTSADYAYKVDQAEQLYTQYVTEGVVAFMGWGTGDTEALRTKIAADKIPFMSASYSANLLNMADAPYNFLIGTSYSDQALIAMTWAMQDWTAAGNSGVPKIALIHHDSPFGQSPVNDAKAFADKNGIEFMSLPMPAGATDYVAELAQVQQFGANYAIVHTVSSPAAVLVKDAKAQGMSDKMKFVLLNWAADEIFINLAGEASEGVIGTIPFTPPSSPVPGHDDAAKWLTDHGSSLEEKGLHYTQGWWTMAVMSEGVKRALDSGKELNGENIRTALESIQGFDTKGITSPISFSATSHKGNSSLRLYQVTGGKWTQVSDFISAAP